MTHPKLAALAASLCVAVAAAWGATQVDVRLAQRYAAREATFHAALDGDAAASRALAADVRLAPFAALVPAGGVPAEVAARQAHALELVDAAFRGDRRALRALRAAPLVPPRVKSLAAYPPSNALSRNLALKTIHAMLLDARPALVVRLEAPALARVHAALAAEQKQALASPAARGAREGLSLLAAIALAASGVFAWRRRAREPGNADGREPQPTE